MNNPMMKKRQDADEAPRPADHEAVERWLQSHFGPVPIARIEWRGRFVYQVFHGQHSYLLEVSEEAYEYETGDKIASKLDRENIANIMKARPKVRLRYIPGGQVVASRGRPSSLRFPTPESITLHA